jgi:hypothetical protein
MATIYELDNEQEYEAEVSQCVGVTGYHHWFFLSALAEAFKLQFRAFAVDSGGERLGVVPLLFQRRGIVSSANLHPIGCIGPVIRGDALRAGRVGELLRGVEPVLWRHRVVAVRWAFSPGLNVSTEHLATSGYEVSEWENYAVSSTKSVDDCLKSMSTGRRQSIRQTEARGVFVEDSSAEEIIRWFPEQISRMYERQDLLPLYRLAEIRALAEGFATHPRMLWRTAKTADGNVLGMTGSVIGDDRLWGWQMVGPPVRGISAQTLLHWDSIKWALARELTYDLGGVPNEGIRVVKVSLGAEAETAVGAVRFRPRAAYKAGTALYDWGMNRLVKRQNGRA